MLKTIKREKAVKTYLSRPQYQQVHNSADTHLKTTFNFLSCPPTISVRAKQLREDEECI